MLGNVSCEIIDAVVGKELVAAKPSELVVGNI